ASRRYCCACCGGRLSMPPNWNSPTRLRGNGSTSHPNCRRTFARRSSACERSRPRLPPDPNARMPDPKLPETITLRLPSRLELLAVLDRVALTVCERMELDEDTSSQVCMSVIEAGTNAVQHGHKRDPGKFFETEFRLYPDRLEVDVRDQGNGF